MHGTCQIDVTCTLMVVCDIMSQNKEECEKYNKILLKVLLFVVYFFGGGGQTWRINTFSHNSRSLVGFFLWRSHPQLLQNYNDRCSEDVMQIVPADFVNQ